MAKTRSEIYRRLGFELAVTVVVAVAGAFFIDFVNRVQAAGTYPWLTTPIVAGIEAAIIVLVAYLFTVAITGAVRDRMISAGYPEHTARIRLVIILLVTAAVLLAILGLPGGEWLTGVLFGAAVLGLILGLALQPVLSNAFAGVVIVLAAPFKVGDRIALILSNPSPVAPSYPRELAYPSYSGTVLDVGIIYTEIKLDSGEVTRFPNAVVLASPAVQVPKTKARAQRIRLTFPVTVSVASVEALLPDAQRVAGGLPQDAQSARLLVADVTPSTWDGVLCVWTLDSDESAVRDRVLRLLQGLLEAAPSVAAPGAGTKP